MYKVNGVRCTIPSRRSGEQAMAGATNRWDEQVNNPGARHETAAHSAFKHSLRETCVQFSELTAGRTGGIGCGLDPSEP